MYLAALGVRAMPSARERRAVRRARVLLATCVLPISAVCQCYWPPRWRASANRCLLLLGTGHSSVELKFGGLCVRALPDKHPYYHGGHLPRTIFRSRSSRTAMSRSAPLAVGS